MVAHEGGIAAASRAPASGGGPQAMTSTDPARWKRYGIRLDPPVRTLFALMGAPARSDYLEVTPTEVRARFGWKFSANIPVSAIRSVRRYRNDYRLRWGAQPVFSTRLRQVDPGIPFAGGWVVSGSTEGFVEIFVDPPQNGSFCRIIPFPLQYLWVTLDEPDRFVAEMNSGIGRPPA